MHGMKRVAALATLTAALLLPATGAGATGTHGHDDVEDATSTVGVVHGIPGADLGLDPALPVDVLVNGSICAYTDLQFGQVAPRVELPQGTYDLEVKLSDGACGGDTAIERGRRRAARRRGCHRRGPPRRRRRANLVGVRRRPVADPALPGSGRGAPHGGGSCGRRDAHLHVRPRSLDVPVRGAGRRDQRPAGRRRDVGRTLRRRDQAGRRRRVDDRVLGTVDPERRQLHAIYAVGSLSTGTFTVIVDEQPTEGGSA